MSLTVKDDGGGDYFQPEAGMHPARCYGIVDLGNQESMYGLKHQVLIMFELVECKHVFNEENGPESAVLSKFFTASLNEKANLTAALQSWRGKPFTEDELKGFELKKVLGAPCLLNVLHKEKDGKSRAQINTIAPAMKGQQVADLTLNQIYYEIEQLTGGDYEKLPQWIKLKLNDSEEFQHAGIQYVADKERADNSQDYVAPSGGASKAEEEDDSIPF